MAHKVNDIKSLTQTNAPPFIRTTRKLTLPPFMYIYNSPSAIATTKKITMKISETPHAL